LSTKINNFLTFDCPEGNPHREMIMRRAFWAGADVELPALAA
jgi:hypothetical protein